MMRATTLIRPWDWAILYAGKDVENRSWPIPRALLGEPIALHSGQGFLPMEERTPPLLHCQGAPREYDEPADGRMPWPANRIVGVMWFSGYSVFPSRWRNGAAFAWDIARVFRLPEPIEGVKGRQRLWTLPEPIEVRVRAQMAA